MIYSLDFNVDSGWGIYFIVAIIEYIEIKMIWKRGDLRRV